MNNYRNYNELNKTEKEKVITHLLALGNKEIEPKENFLGICEEVNEALNISRSVLYSSFKTWPEFSGKEVYPVSHPNAAPRFAFYDVDNLWDNNAYGDSRRSLCLHIANELQKELER
jgi:hypothetical protein